MIQILRDMLARKHRSFRADSIRFLRSLPIRYAGPEPDASGQTLFLVNHYSRPGIPAWVGPMAVAARLSAEMHWAMTSAWTYPDPARSRLVTPFTEWALARLATVYGFTTMPPMPPHPEDMLRRVTAVRRILKIARASHPAIGLVPEGMDSPDGRLMDPPPGVGRFIGHIAQEGYVWIPVGVWRDDSKIHVRFGASFVMDPIMGESPQPDRFIAHQVMAQIATLLPSEMRGSFGEEIAHTESADYSDSKQQKIISVKSGLSV
jgi:hypothetical protein